MVNGIIIFPASFIHQDYRQQYPEFHFIPETEMAQPIVYSLKCDPVIFVHSACVIEIINGVNGVPAIVGDSAFIRTEVITASLPA